MNHFNRYISVPLLLLCFNSCDTTKNGKAQLERFSEYFLAVKEDKGNKWNYSTDTVRLWFDDKNGEPILQIRDQESTGVWKQWDEEMNSVSDYDSIWFYQEENAIKGYFYENNDFYRLIGKGPTKTLRTYWLNERNLVKEILIYWIPEENTHTSEHLKPIVEWALEYDSVEIRELYPDNRIIPSLENAQRWKVLLDEYHRNQDKD